MKMIDADSDHRIQVKTHQPLLELDLFFLVDDLHLVHEALDLLYHSHPIRVVHICNSCSSVS
jgi:hypothetical protein